MRLVHLLDEQKRNELMIIYSEDVAPTGLTAGELHEGGKTYDQWPAIEKKLVDRAISYDLRPLEEHLQMIRGRIRGMCSLP